MEINGKSNKQILSKLNESVSLDRNSIVKKEKIDKIESYFIKILEVLELDINDPSLKETPKRIAKMYVEEIFKGLDLKKFPNISFFENNYDYNEMILVNDITLYSYCEHHFVPFIGKVHIAYFANKKVIGLSKLNRIVDFLSSKPQVQEKLTMEIGNTLISLLETANVAVHIEADHLCVASRGIKDIQSYTKTYFFEGKFKKEKTKRQFLDALKNK